MACQLDNFKYLGIIMWSLIYTLALGSANVRDKPNFFLLPIAEMWT